MANINDMKKRYDNFSKAKQYILGFAIGEDVYFTLIDDIPSEMLCIQRESKSNGGSYGLYISMRSLANRLTLWAMENTVKLCKVSDLEDTNGHINKQGKVVYYNKGVMFEKKIYEYYGQEFRGKDNVPFHISGDITIDDMEVQIKYRYARLCYESTLDRLEMAIA